MMVMGNDCFRSRLSVNPLYFEPFSVDSSCQPNRMESRLARYFVKKYSTSAFGVAQWDGLADTLLQCKVIIFLFPFKMECFFFLFFCFLCLRRRRAKECRVLSVSDQSGPVLECSGLVSAVNHFNFGDNTFSNSLAHMSRSPDIPFTVAMQQQCSACIHYRGNRAAHSKYRICLHQFWMTLKQIICAPVSSCLLST